MVNGCMADKRPRLLEIVLAATLLHSLSRRIDMHYPRQCDATAIDPLESDAVFSSSATLACCLRGDGSTALFPHCRNIRRRVNPVRPSRLDEKNMLSPHHHWCGE
jgi:hypothetical protein